MDNWWKPGERATQELARGLQEFRLAAALDDISAPTVTHERHEA